ncbi:MAG: hypothetical protein Q8L55_03810, partial [Phycisphaerales bacterium]|nr:hypothetical protein [Phycisphaerales bacterium]
MSAADVFDRIESAVKSTGWAKEESLGRFLSFNRCSDPDKTPLLELLLHPSAEAVEFRVSEKRVVVSAKTSTVGPGYHAAVVSIIDEIGMAGFEWDWTEDDNSSGDETGYSTHRNFSRLQQSMAEFFGNLMKVVEEQVFDEYDGSAAVNVRMDSQRPTGMTGMVFPLGVRPRSWCVAAGESPSNYAMEF